MKLTVGLDFDAGSYPGVLASGERAFNQAWVGPLGLLGVLETHLGLGGAYPSLNERAASLVRHLTEEPTFYRSSAQVDPLGTARRLLQDRDALYMSGWRGQPFSPRLQQLQAITARAGAGLPDRLMAVAQALQRRRTPIGRVQLMDPPAAFPELWRQVLNLLPVEVAAPSPAPGDAQLDLHAARDTNFTPTGDGSLQLFCPYGELQAADDVAAWLAAQPNPGRVLIIGPTGALDRALRRHGLPTTGAPGHPTDNLSPQLLPLLIEAAWLPPDPQRVLELLSIPRSPIPRGLARRLIDALHTWPAVGSPVWNEALEGYLQDKEPALRARVHALLTPVVPRQADAFPLAELHRRLDVVRTWLRGQHDRGREAHGQELTEREPSGQELTEQKLTAREPTGQELTEQEPQLPWQAASEQASSEQAAPSQAASEQALPHQHLHVHSLPGRSLDHLLRDLHASGQEAFTAAQLRRFVALALEQSPTWPHCRAEAGLAAVTQPGAVVGPADTIIWWGFHHHRVGALPTPPARAAERQALAQLGVHLPSPGDLARERARRWRRPLQHARSRLLLVSPQHTEAGEAAHPHPLWDEIVANMPAPARTRGVAALKVALPTSCEAPRTPMALHPLPGPTHTWTLRPNRLTQREEHSPSSMASLVGCSLQWVLRYVAKLEDGAPGPLAMSSREIGALGHAVLAEVLASLPADPDRARARAGELFDTQGPWRLAALFQPGTDAERADVRNRITDSAAELTRWLHAHGRTVLAVEEKRVRTTPLGPLAGRMDLVLGPQEAVVDLKWGSRTEHSDALRDGVAHQLAAYSFILAEGRPAPPPVAYFIVRDQTLLTTDAAGFPGGVTLSGPTPSQTWDHFAQAQGARWRELQSGQVLAPGNPNQDGEVGPNKDTVEGGALRLEAPCRFCDYAGLCGRAFGGAP